MIPRVIKYSQVSVTRNGNYVFDVGITLDGQKTRVVIPNELMDNSRTTLEEDLKQCLTTTYQVDDSFTLEEEPRA